MIEANASLRELIHRNTEQQYWEYVKRLAAAAGIDPDDTKAVRQFDRKREGRSTSNTEWVNPHDPDAKVGVTKHGACDMIYKPEHITDLESGAIVAATVRLGNEGDTKELTDRVLATGTTLARVCNDPRQDKVLQSLTADEGYFSVEETCGLQGEHIRTIIGDPHASKRRKENQGPIIKQVLHKARRAVKSASGKALLRKRGQYIERSFAHLLDQGGLRRATLRGKSNLTKRQLAAALAFDLSLLMRKLTGCGTPKQWLAEAHWALITLFRWLIEALSRRGARSSAGRITFRTNHSQHTPPGPGNHWIAHWLESGGGQQAANPNSVSNTIFPAPIKLIPLVSYTDLRPIIS